VGDVRTAFEQISAAGAGVLLMLQKPSIDADALALKPLSNVEPIRGGGGQRRLKEFGIGAQILQDLGIKRLKLLTNTPNPIVGVERYGLEVVGQIPLTPQPKQGGGKRRKSVG
jgi:3,4-dihydroxy 2-butanone 4-phosphate synthase/GTP cyclohydrolase II